MTRWPSAYPRSRDRPHGLLASALLLAGAALAVLGNALHPILSEPGEV